MSSEELTITVRKRKGADDRIVLQIVCPTRSEGIEGIPSFHMHTDVEEDIRRVYEDERFKALMEEIEKRVARLVCMQLY
jgi:hypothetical protein